MSDEPTPFVPDDVGGRVIEIDRAGGVRRRRRGRKRWLILAVVVALIALSRAAGIYVEALWFGSLG